jgi:hypothetical protein
MATDLSSLLVPQVILRVVSRIRSGQGRFGRWLGFHGNNYNPDTVTISGPNTIQGDTRYAEWRIYDNVRTVAKSRAPGTGAATVPPNPVGATYLSCARFHEKVPLNFEKLSNLSSVVGPNSAVDQGGQDYVRRQVRTLAQKMNNAVELMAAGMCRGQFYLNQIGDSFYPTLTQPTAAGAIYVTVNFQVPSGNQNQLNMFSTGNLLTVSWLNPGAPLIQDLANVSAAYAKLNGFVLRHIWLNKIMWTGVILNNQVRNTAGSAETPFAQYDRVPEMGADGLPINEYAMQLRGDPTIVWHADDEVLITNADIDPTYATAPSSPTAVYDKVCPDNYAMFLPDADSLWCELYLGAEMIVENDGMPATLKRGFATWTKWVSDPSAIELFALLNALPLLYVPKAVCYAQIAGF